MSAKIIRFLVHAFFRLTAHVEVFGLSNLPAEGSYIVAANHLGRLDAILVYYLLDRQDIILMVAEKYHKYAFIRWLARKMDAIFLNRFDADLHALRIVMKRLQEGDVLVMAPEGTRSRTGALIEGKPGVSYLAAKTGLPLIPVAVTGSEDALVKAQLKRLKKPHIVVRVGYPLAIPPINGRNRDAQLQKYTDEIMCQIAALLPPAYRGVYADHPRLKQLLDKPPFNETTA